MNEITSILIEKKLAGALSEEEATELARLLERDPRARSYFEELRRDEALLEGHREAGLARVDWHELRRVRRPMAIHHALVVLLWVSVTIILADYALAKDEPWRVALGLVVVAGLILHLASAIVEMRRSRRNFRWLETDEGPPFLEKYRIVLEKEWKRAKSASGGAGCLIFVALIMIAFNRVWPVIGTLALTAVVKALYDHFFLLAPLRRERAELSKGRA
jgi:hypothetical protein